MKYTQLPALLLFLRAFTFPWKLGLLELLFGSRLKQKGLTWVMTSQNIPWKLDLRNPTHRWIVYGCYQGESFIRWFKNSLPPSPTIIDSGANIGQFLLYFITSFPGASVLAIEPGKLAREWLSECLGEIRNGTTEVIPYALGNENKEMAIVHAGETIFHGGQARIQNSGEERVLVRTLDSLLTEKEISIVDLWKLDVEGFELQALQGAYESLRSLKVKHVYVELLGDDSTAIFEFLTGLGYKANLIDTLGRPYEIDSSYEGTNTLFIAPSVL